jgi:hypothetical protein
MTFTYLFGVGKDGRIIAVFWDVMSCSLVDIYQCFEGTCCLHLQTTLNIYQTAWPYIL